ncbi:MAG TPA: hypothetical protein VGR72_11810 [Candidatus Acidoferrales bacterium]|nr:hypothetical protein [Candidatus Acidoferrales bacterium]
MNMSKGRKTRLAVFVAVVAMLLVVAATTGCVWHHHATASAETSCPVCHLGHQSFQQPAVIQTAPTLIQAGPGPVLLDPLFVRGPVSSRAPTRAPPAV